LVLAKQSGNGVAGVKSGYVYSLWHTSLYEFSNLRNTGSDLSL